jgi:tryptophanase
MNIPANFQATISAIFYDKTVNLYTVSSVTDDVGWSRRNDATVASTFKANVSFSSLDKVQEAYGVTDVIDVVLTTAQNVAVNSVIGYGGHKYKVIRAVPSDTHYTLLGQRWLSRSSI